MIPFILKYSYSFRERSEFLLIITLVGKYASIIQMMDVSSSQLA